MSLHHIPLDRITPADIRALLDGAVSESKTCDYKHSLPPDSEEKWQDFLSDLTSFANADGGDILFGIREGEGAEKGVAKEIVGLRDFVKDTWVSRAEAKMASNIQPRLMGVRFVEHRVDGASVLMVRIPRSHVAPHATKLDKGHRFCTRGEQGKVELDVSGIRASCVASEGLLDRLRGFRLQRIGKLTEEAGGPTLVVHLLPFLSARPDFRLNSDALFAMQKSHATRLLRAGRGYSPRYTFDGISFVEHRGDIPLQKITLFRQGFFEAVTYDLCLASGEHGSTLPWGAWEKEIRQAIPVWTKQLAEQGIPGPYLASVSLLWVGGLRPAHYEPFDPRYAALDRDHLLTEEVELHADAGNVASALRPIFDQVWNAFGVAASPAYDSNGNLRPQ